LDCEGVIVIYVLPRGQTINPDVYVETVKKRFRRVRPHKDVTKVLLPPRQCEATHKSAYARGHNKASVDCPASSTLQPGSDYHILSPLKDAVHGKKLEDDEEVISEVKRWLRQRPAEWYREGIQALTSQWRKAIDSEGDCVEKWV
jgi:hypothetical protein